jgi:hypothetical protein
VPPVHEVAQLPQCAAVVVLSVQPAVRLVQAPKPALHAGAQVLPPHVEPLAFTVKHLTLQAPQLFGSLAVGVSQPLFGLLSQSL